MQPLLQFISNKYYIFWVGLFNLRHPVYNVHAPYCHMWSVRLYRIFPHYLMNGAIFEKKNVIEDEHSVLIFSTTFVRNTSNSKNN
jgi:hypothetical protein